MLDIEPGNRKALYRRGQGHAAAGDAHRAVPDLEAALAASPANEKEAIAEKLEAARKLASEAEPQEEAVEEDVEEVCAAYEDCKGYEDYSFYKGFVPSFRFCLNINIPLIVLRAERSSVWTSGGLSDVQITGRFTDILEYWINLIDLVC